MNNMKSYINDYIVENVKFFNEFDRSSFANNAVYALNKASVNSAIAVKGDHFSNMLEKTISHIGEIEIDSYAISEFITKILGSGRVESSKLSMKDIGDYDNITIKPQYLTEAVYTYKYTIDSIASGKYDANKVRSLCVNINAYITATKKRMVSSNIDTNLTSKDMLKYDNFKVINVTTKYLEDVVIPFLEDVPKKKKALTTEISAINATVRESISELYRLVENVTTGINLNKIDDDKKKLMLQYTFNQVRAILEAVSFVAYVAMRKVHQFEDSVVECQNIYNTLTLAFNDVTTLVESGTFDNKVISATDANNIAEKLVDGDNDLFAELAHNIIEYHKGYVSTWPSDVTNVTGTESNNIMDTLLTQIEYKRTVYNDIIKAYIEIGNGLDILAKNCDDYLLIFDQAIKKAGFVVELVDRFHNEINALDDLSYYGMADIEIGNAGEKTTIYHTILAEINAYPDITAQIAKAAKMVKTKSEYVEDLFTAKKNGELAYSETMNELKIFVDSFNDQFKYMNCQIVKGLYMRLKLLAAKADDCLDNVNSTPENDMYTPEDFFKEAVLSEIDFIDSYNDIVMETMMREYYSEREFLERGVRLVYEADENTTVKVVDNSEEASTDSPKSGVSMNALNNLVQKIGEWFTKMIDTFNEITGRAAAKNTKWLSENKEGLMSRSYSNVEIQILPYDQMSHTNIIADIGKLANNIKVMTLDNIKNIDSYEDLRSKLINFGPRFTKDSDEKSVIVNYYKVGNRPLETVAYSNNNIKNIIVNNMIPYCENFYGSYKQEINNQLNSVKDALENISKTYVTEAVREISNISIITEADATASDEKPVDMSTKAGWLRKCAQTYSGAVLNSIRDRNNDYFKVLNALAVKKKPTNPNPSEESNTNTEEVS